MMIRNLNDLVETSRGKGKKRLIVAYAQDAHTLEAVNDACQMGLVEATLIGDPAEIEKVCKQENIDYSQFTIIAESNDIKCVSMAVKMVSEGQGDVLMKGLVSTDKYMRGILSKEYGLVPPKGVLSHVTLMQIPNYHKLVLVSDVAILPCPDLNQKISIIKYLISTAKSLGVDTPKIACIAPSEQLLTGITSSTDAAILSKMADRGQFGKVYVDGPLALDIALFEDIVKLKKLEGSSVAGNPDCLLFPNLDSANVFFKSVTKIAGGDLACMVVGTKVPCVLTSRGDSRQTKLNSIALACLSAN